MVARQKWLVIAMATSVVACASEAGDSQSAQVGANAHSPDGGSWRDRYLLLGKETYEHACASCHDNGAQGAPAKGDRDAWSKRSPLWSAVLIEHAKSGYLAMPPRGGHPELTDRAVEAAGEYMLSETFPELPLD